MQIELLALGGIAALLLIMVLLDDWRKGLLLCIPIGFLQDPLRKIMPGEPVVMVVLVVAVVALVALVALQRTGPVRLNKIFFGDKALQQAAVLFVSLVLLQAIHSFVRFGSPMMSMIGILSYLSPLLALWLAIEYVRNERDITRLLWLYVIVASVASGTLWLDFLGYDFAIFKEVGSGLHIYDRYQKAYIAAYTGIMRAPEVAAWHAGAGASLLMVLVIGGNDRKKLLIAVPLVLLMVIGGMLTGRRKMLMGVILFLVLYGMFALFFNSHMIRKKIISLIISGALFVFALLVFAPQQQGIDAYATRSGSGFEDASERFVSLGLGSVLWAVNRTGFLGAGVGVGSQGAQHFGRDAAGLAGASEGGLGKIVVELGLPGLLLVMLFTYLLAKYIWRILKYVQRKDPPLLRILLGLVAFLLANIPVFIGASQIYGDPFVLLILGWCLGFVLAAPRLVERKSRVRLMQQQMHISAIEPAGISHAPGH